MTTPSIQYKTIPHIRHVDERVKFRKNSCSYDGKLFLKADVPQVDQRHGHVERKQEYIFTIVLLICPPRKPLTLGREKTLTRCSFCPFLRSLAIYVIVHSIPLEDADRDFPFNEDETRRHFSYLSGTFTEPSF